MLGMVLLAFLLVGCSSPEPVPTPMPPPPARSKAKSKGGVPSVKSKARTGNMVHGKGKAKAKAGPPRSKAPVRRPPAVGAAGPVKGYLVLTPKEGERVETTASMVLAWGDKTSNVRLGDIEGVCSSTTPVAVGPEGKEQRTPLWTVSCVDNEVTSELYVLQVKTLLAVVRGTPGQTKKMVYKPVRRVPLAAGAVLERAEGAPPAVAQRFPAADPTPTPVAAPVAGPVTAPVPAPTAAPAPAPRPDMQDPWRPVPAPTP